MAILRSKSFGERIADILGQIDLDYGSIDELIGATGTEELRYT